MSKPNFSLGGPGDEFIHVPSVRIDQDDEYITVSYDEVKAVRTSTGKLVRGDTLPVKTLRIPKSELMTTRPVYDLTTSVANPGQSITLAALYAGIASIIRHDQLQRNRLLPEQIAEDAAAAAAASNPNN